MKASVVVATIAQAGAIGNQGGGGGGGGQVTSKGSRHMILQPLREEDTRWWQVIVSDYSERIRVMQSPSLHRLAWWLLLLHGLVQRWAREGGMSNL